LEPFPARSTGSGPVAEPPLSPAHDWSPRPPATTRSPPRPQLRQQKLVQLLQTPARYNASDTNHGAEVIGTSSILTSDADGLRSPANGLTGRGACPSSRRDSLALGRVAGEPELASRLVGDGLVRCRLFQEVEELADRGVAVPWVAERQRFVYVVPVSASVADLREVAGFDEIVDDPCRGSLG
jgi:hypothetical protein